MKKITQLILTLVSAFFYCSGYAAIPNRDNPDTFLGPMLHASLNGLLTDASAYSFAGEAGLRNFRAGATAGIGITDNHLIKFSFEYLTQQIKYPFFTGNLHKSVYQGAVGGTYLFQPHPFSGFNPQFTVSAYYANASTITIGTETSTFINAAGVTVPYTVTQRLAGSNAVGISPGFAIRPWLGAKVGIDLNYDDVRYNLRYEHKQTASGFGGTLHAKQWVINNIWVGGSAAIRQPFNNYQADVAFVDVPFFGIWTLKFIGAYTVGKKSLPNTYNFGLSADYFLDHECGCNCVEDMRNQLLAWTSDPAVYMPQVLQVRDEAVIV